MFWHAIDCVIVSAYFECVYKVVSFAAVFRVVTQRPSSPCGEKRCVTTLKTAAKETIYKVASIISVKERERERKKIEELLVLPDSSHVSVISFDCQLAFRNANGEKTIHPFKFHNISTKPDVSKNQLGVKDGMSRKVRNLSPVIKKFIFSQLLAFLTGCSLLDLEPNTWRLMMPSAFYSRRDIMTLKFLGVSLEKKCHLLCLN